MLPRGARNIRVPRPRNRILQAQEDYLRTGDMKYIEIMYHNLLMDGFFNLARLGRYQDEDDAKDIASDICMRLIEKKEPIILGAPSAYIKRALIYKGQKKRGPDDIDEYEDTEGRDGSDLWDCIDRIIEVTGLTDSDEDILARLTLESRTSWRKVYRNITDPTLRKEYKERMKEIEQCVRSYANSRGASEQ